VSDVAVPVPAASVRDQLRRLSVLIATCFVDMIGFAIVLPILPFYASTSRHPPSRSADHRRLLGGADPVGAHLGTGLGQVRAPSALLIGLMAAAAAYVVFGLAHSLWLLFLSRLIQGAGGGTTASPTPTSPTRSSRPIGRALWAGSLPRPRPASCWGP